MRDRPLQQIESLRIPAVVRFEQFCSPALQKNYYIKLNCTNFPSKGIIRSSGTLHFALFSYVSSKCSSERMHNHTGCICFASLAMLWLEIRLEIEHVALYSMQATPPSQKVKVIKVKVRKVKVKLEKKILKRKKRLKTGLFAPFPMQASPHPS